MSTKAKIEKLKLKLDVLITQKMQKIAYKNWLSSMKPNFEKLQTKLDLKELELQELK